MNSIRYLSQHNPHPGTPNDADNRRLCWQARHAETEGERLAARNELVMRNQGLITKAARRFPSRLSGMMDDLISEGQLGLIRAIDNFDFSRGLAFSTYAVHSIYRKMQDATYVHGRVIHVPHHFNLASHAPHLRADAERAQWVVSLDPLEAGAIPDREPEPTREDWKAEVGPLLSRLTEQQRELLSLYYGLESESEEGLTDHEIGKRLKVTPQNVAYHRRRSIMLMARAARREMVG